MYQFFIFCEENFLHDVLMPDLIRIANSPPFTRRSLLQWGSGAMLSCVAGSAVSAQRQIPRAWYVDAASLPLAEGKTHTLDASRMPRDLDAAQLRRVLHWPRQAMRLIVKYQQNPLRAARALAYVNVAMHDAWVYALRTDANAVPEFAVHRAASLMLEQLYPNETPGQFEAQFAALVPAPLGDAAWRAGQAVARALIDRSLRDGAGRVWPPSLRPAGFDGIWQPTYPMFAANPTEGLAPEWRPWLDAAPGRYEPPVAPRPGSALHARETREVLDVARTLTPARAQAAQDWNLEAGSVTPGGVWMQHAMRELLTEQAEEAAARADAMPRVLPVLAALGVALHDAFVACWRMKLRDWSERPITAVRRQLDASFAPLLVTPGFPSYVSGHATISAAAATVLTHFWPARRGHFDAMSREAAMSRLWGGIHFRSDNEEGLLLGSAVGAETVGRLASPA